ncbi:MAG: ABC transporter substrate-binding protein [Ktedonobacteraceae bacterium]|nr:ABC transporter substrate-binding protein [Ktedonobacteraceae bacterium]
MLSSLLLSACGGSSSSSSGPKQIKTIGLTVQAISNPFFVAIQHGAEAEAKKIGASVLLEDANHDIGKQSDEIDDFIQKQVDLILLNAVDSAGVAPAVKRAVDAGIPVIAVDVGANGGVAATVASDNVAAGRLVCQYMSDRLKGQGNIAIVDGPPVTAVIDRVKGCKEVLTQHPGLKVVATQVGTGDRDKGLELGTSILTANSHLDAVFAINDPTALGVALAAQQAKRNDFFIVGVDGSPDAANALKQKGIFAATSAQSPYDIARTGVQIGEKVVVGQKPSSTSIKVPVSLVTQDNVGSYKGWQ